MEVNKLFGVDGQVVLITGGSRGIGKMMAEGFVRNGAKVYISSRDKKACDETANELNAIGRGQCIPIPEDLSTIEGCQRLATALQERESKLHTLINNSGIAWGGGFPTHDKKGWNKVMDLNLTAPFFLTKFLLPVLQTNARVINVGSVAGVMPQKIGTFAYDTSKAAVHHLTKVLAAELAPLKINVNCIAPGLVPTKMSKQIVFVTGKKFEEMAVEGIPLSRPGVPTDMAGAALFFASPASAWITGATLVVDGGQVNAARSGGESKLTSKHPTVKTKLPVLTQPTSPRLSDVALTTVFKSDFMLLAMKYDKLLRLWGKESKRSNQTSCDYEMKSILAQNTTAEAIQAKLKCKSLHEAVCTLSQMDLKCLVEKKMEAIEKLVLQNTHVESSNPEEHNYPATLSRLPTFLAMIDRLMQLHSSAEEATKRPPPITNQSNNLPILPQTEEDTSQVKQLKNQVIELEAKLEEHNAKYLQAETKLHRELDALKEECTTQNQTIKNVHDKIQASQRDLVHAKQELETAQCKIELLQQECHRHDKALAKALDARDSISKQLIERDATVCQLKSEIINAKQQLDKQTNQDVQEITKKLANAQDKIELLQSKIQQFEMLVAGYTEEDDALVHRIERW
ncbi:hypothetical protein AeRB84_005684 [Aphanomyces euteiches]|nr:hypothetical protein AeRB84_005684 [Aphanomyces euteiches]